MMEYAFGFLIGSVTMYICFTWQFKQFDEVIKDIHKELTYIKENL